MPAIQGISSRIGTCGFAVQASKGTPAAHPTVKAFFNAVPTVSPYNTEARFAMTDANRDQGDIFMSQIGVVGDLPVYCHDGLMGFLWHAALGANVDSGAADPWTHTATPANDLPYLTIWRMVGNTITEQFVDCKVTTLTIDGGAGAPLTAVVSIMGITPTFLAADDLTVNPFTASPYLFMDGAGALKIDTVAYPIHAINMVVDNGLQPFQADGYTVDSIDPGPRTISGSYSVRFGSAIGLPLDYRKYFYGTDAGTAQTTTFLTHALDFLWTRQAAPLHTMEIQLPVVHWADVPVQPDPGGTVLEVACAFDVLRAGYTTSVENPVCTVITKDIQPIA